MRSLRRAILPLLAFETILATVLFGAAGRFDLPWFWALLGAHATLVAVGTSFVDRSLWGERVRPGPGARDRGFRPLLVACILAHLVVAALDAGRFGWSRVMPTALRGVALASYALGVSLSMWAMAANRFFSSVVRVQLDRGHRVIRDGPYRWVRHPGYLGMLVAVVSESFVLGSLWSLLPLAAFGVVLVARTAIEDRMLRGELPGYEQYACDVTYRLAPGVW
jgi:protein-S-isoprenylcysteine O-methyltransferase Ste14